jgi:hypothetical protein
MSSAVTSSFHFTLYFLFLSSFSSFLLAFSYKIKNQASVSTLMGNNEERENTQKSDGRC